MTLGAALVRTDQYILPSLSLRLAMIAKEADGGQIELRQNPINPSHFAVKSLELTKEAEVIHNINVSPQASGRINYAGPRYTFPHISALEVLQSSEKDLRITQSQIDERGQLKVIRNEAISKDFLKDKIVIIGATAPGIYDLRVTPFDENFPGVEAHINATENILYNRFLNDSLKLVIYFETRNGIP